jgi:hypothetical protein
VLKTEKKINLYFSKCSVSFDFEEINFRDPHSSLTVKFGCDVIRLTGMKLIAYVWDGLSS